MQNWWESSQWQVAVSHGTLSWQVASQLAIGGSDQTLFLGHWIIMSLLYQLGLFSVRSGKSRHAGVSFRWSECIEVEDGDKF